MIGRVTSNKAQKTATVLLERTKRHPLYKKDFVSTKKYLVDDQIGVKIGDIVEIVKCAPVSKNKHWRITKVLGTDVVALGEESMKEVAAEAIAEVLPEESEETDVVLGSEATPESSEKDSGQARKTTTKKGKKE